MAPSVHVEFNSLRKHCQTTLSLVFNSWEDFKLTGSPFNSLIGEFLVPLHSDNSPWYFKIGMVGYMATHLAFALVLPTCLTATFVWLWVPFAREYVLSALQVLQTVTCVFAIFGSATLQVIKRVHLIPTLRKTDAAGAIPVIALPGVYGVVKEVLVYGLIAQIFWTGLHVHLFGVLVCFFFGKKISFGAAHAATNETTGESWLGATKRVLCMYPPMYTFLGASLGALLTLLLLADYAPDVLEPPDGEDSIPRYEWLLPLLLVLLGPMVAPLLLDLMNMPFSKVPRMVSPKITDPALNNADSSNIKSVTPICAAHKRPANAETQYDCEDPTSTYLPLEDWRTRAAKGKMALPIEPFPDAPPTQSRGGSLLVGQSVSSGGDLGGPSPLLDTDL